MKPKIAVFGAGNVGQTITADLTLGGYEVNLLELPEYKQNISGIQKLGGIHLRGEGMRSGKGGLAKPNMVTINPKEALEDVDLIFIDVPVGDYENRIDAIAPYLTEGQILNFQTYGYWACLRVAGILRQMGKGEVTLSESPVALYWCQAKDGYATTSFIRKQVHLAVFPDKKSKQVFNVLNPVFPTFTLAKNVLQTNFENINMLAHPFISILNVGYLDRAKEKEERIGFYKMGNTVHTGILTEAFERERMAICQAYDVPYTSIIEHLKNYYKAKGNTVYEAILNNRTYQNWMTSPIHIYRGLVSRDIPKALIPLALLANLAGVSTPILQGIINIMGAIFETDFWKTGLTLEKLGLGGLTPPEVVRFVREGDL